MQIRVAGVASSCLVKVRLVERADPFPVFMMHLIAPEELSIDCVPVELQHLLGLFGGMPPLSLGGTFWFWRLNLTREMLDNR